MFSGIWHTMGNTGNYIYYGMEPEWMNNKIEELKKQDFYMIDIEHYMSNGKDWFAGLWVYKGSEAYSNPIIWDMSLPDLESNIQKFDKDGLQITDIESYIDSSGNRLWAGIWEAARLEVRAVSYEKDLKTFATIADENRKAGLYIMDIDTYVDKSGKRLWAGIWEGWKIPNAAEARTTISYQMSPDEVERNIHNFPKEGWAMTDLETYTDQGNRYWVGVWTHLAAGGHPGHAIPDMDEVKFDINLKTYVKTDVLSDLDIYEPRATGEAGDVPCYDNPGKPSNE